MSIESGEKPTDDGLPGKGAVIAGKYRVDKVLATGGMGTILGATHLTLGQKVAIKVLLPEVADKAEFVERFLREARASVGLRGEHAVRVFDVGKLDSGSPYMVMEYLRGHDLAYEVMRRGPLPIDEAVDYVLQACEALAEAHRLGIVHRDLKPANLFLARQPDSSRSVKVLDFGISKRIHGRSKDHRLTMASTLLGSPQYMSPEQVRNAKAIDGRADIWALGVVLYELLTDATPFSGDTVSSIAASIVADEPHPIEKLRPELPEDLAAIVYRCLEKNPEKRYPDIPDLVEALLPFGPDHARPSLLRVRNIVRGSRSGKPDSDYPKSGPMPDSDHAIPLSDHAIPLSDHAIPLSDHAIPLSDAPTVALPQGRLRPAPSEAPGAPSSSPEPGTLAATASSVETTFSRRQRYLALALVAGATLVLLGVLGTRKPSPEAAAHPENGEPPSPVAVPPPRTTAHERAAEISAPSATATARATAAPSTSPTEVPFALRARAVGSKPAAPALEPTSTAAALGAPPNTPAPEPLTSPAGAKSERPTATGDPLDDRK